MARVHDIRKAFFEEGHSLSRIAEEQGIDRKTVALYVGQRNRELGRDAQPALPLVHRPGEAQVDVGEADYLLQGTLVHGFYLADLRQLAGFRCQATSLPQMNRSMMRGVISILIGSPQLPSRHLVPN